MKHQYSDVKEIIIKDKEKYNYYIDINDEKIISDLKDLYNLAISSYAGLIKDLELKSPIEIYILFSMLLKNGYLSHQKSFKKTDDNTVSIFINENLEGVNVLAGEGLCNQTSSLFSDIFNKSNLNSKTVNSFIEKADSKKGAYIKLKNYLETLSAFGIKDTLTLPYIEAITNHTILEVNDDKNSYFFDPINDALLVPKKDKKNTLILPENYDIYVGKNIIKPNTFKDTEVYKEKRKNLNKEFLKNIDIFDKLYKNNEDIYNEVNVKIRKLNKERCY